MSIKKDVLSFYAHAYQCVDIKEAPIAQILVRGAPIGETIVLLLKKFIECVGLAVDSGNCPVDGIQAAGLLRQKIVEQREQYSPVALLLENRAMVITLVPPQTRKGRQPGTTAYRSEESVPQQTETSPSKRVKQVRVRQREQSQSEYQSAPVESIRSRAPLRIGSPSTGNKTLLRMRSSPVSQSISK